MKRLLTGLLLLPLSALCNEILPLSTQDWGQQVFAQTRAANPFKARVEPDAEVTYHNPVIPGFYSDPSHKKPIRQMRCPYL